MFKELDKREVNLVEAGAYAPVFFISPSKLESSCQWQVDPNLGEEF